MENVLNLPSGEVMCTFFDVALSCIKSLFVVLQFLAHDFLRHGDVYLSFKGAPCVSVLEDKGFSY